MTRMPIADIKVGTRVRQDMGDIQGLAESLVWFGLFHPVLVTKDGQLVAGLRRLTAARQIGWKDIPVTIVDTEEMAKAQRDENQARKDYSLSEAVAIGRMVEAEHKAKIAAALHDARARAGETSQARRGSEVEVRDAVAVGRTEDVVRAATGLTPHTYNRAKAVVVAAEAEPEKHGDLVALMDREHSTRTAYRELQHRQGREERHPIHAKGRRRDLHRETERAVIAFEGLAEELGRLARDLAQAGDSIGQVSERWDWWKRVGAAQKHVRAFRGSLTC